jgi:hypothetical protein
MHGPDTTIDNKKYYTSLIDSSIDMQKLYNYSRSEQADAIANSPKPKWLASAESIEGHEDTWNESNIDNAAILPFNPGSSVPQRISPEPPPVALITQADQTAKDIRVLTGVADAVQDSPPAGLSGKAISLSLSQRNVGTFHFPHMYNQFIRVVAATIIDMVSNFWTYEEMVDLLKEDGSIEQVNVNGMVEDDEGNQIIADLTKGSYHVMVANGPSYQDRRQASVDSLLELAKVAPQVLQVGLPILLKNMDFAGAEQMAELLSPKEQEQAPGALPPQLAQQFDQYKSMIEQLTTKLEETQQQLVSKQTENDMKLQSDMAILQAKNDHEIAMARMKFEQDMALAQLNNQSRNMMNMNDNDTTMATNKQDNAVKILAMQQKEMEAPEPPEPEEPEELPPTIMLYP